MPLTTRTNGSAGSNVITASWFNDFKNLLTGAMSDQEVTINNNLTVKAIAGAPSSAASAVLSSGTSLGVGIYKYVYTYADIAGETTGSPSVTITTTTGNQVVSLSAVTVGPTGTTKRKLYRTKVGGSTFFLLATINDNTTTTYSDTTADASLGTALVPTASSFGSLFVQDSTGTVNAILSNAGSLFLTGNPTVVNGNTSGSATVFQAFYGSFNMALLKFSSWVNNGGTQDIPFRAPYNEYLFWLAFGQPPFNFIGGGAPVNASVWNTISSGGASSTTQTTINGGTIGNIDARPAPITAVRNLGGSNINFEGFVLIMGL